MSHNTPASTPLAASQLRAKHGPRIGNALNVLIQYVNAGMEYPNAEWRVIEAGGLNDSEVQSLRAAYDAAEWVQT
jgi:hypothetical protein